MIGSEAGPWLAVLELVGGVVAVIATLHLLVLVDYGVYSWYHHRQLARADPDERRVYLARIIALTGHSFRARQVAGACYRRFIDAETVPAGDPDGGRLGRRAGVWTLVLVAGVLPAGWWMAVTVTGVVYLGSAFIAGTRILGFVWRSWRSSPEDLTVITQNLDHLFGPTDADRQYWGSDPP